MKSCSLNKELVGLQLIEMGMKLVHCVFEISDRHNNEFECDEIINRAQDIASRWNNTFYDYVAKTKEGL